MDAMPAGYDASVWAALPADIRRELCAAAAPAAQLPPPPAYQPPTEPPPPYAPPPPYVEPAAAVVAPAPPPSPPPAPAVTPSTLWRPAALSRSGLAVLGPDELEVCVAPECLVTPRPALAPADAAAAGPLSVTSQRVLWGPFRSAAATATALGFQLSDVRRAERESGRLWPRRHPRVWLWLAGASASADPDVVVSFRAGGFPVADEWLAKLQIVLARRALEPAVRAPPSAAAPPAGAAPPAAPPAFAPGRAGINGLLRKREETQAQRTDLAAAATADMEHLIAKAKDVVALLERCAARPSDDGDGGGGGNGGAAAALATARLELGLHNPVTKDVAGELYYDRLARQLSDFVAPRFEGAGPAAPVSVALTDVYCLYV